MLLWLLVLLVYISLIQRMRVDTIWSGNSEGSLIMRSVTKCILIGAIIGSVSGWFIGEWYVTPYLNQHFFISPITLEDGKQ